MVTNEGLRERKKRETRDAISNAATRLFVQHGFENVTVADVADAANVSKMTVFNYFPRKEDLFFDREGEVDVLVANALANRPENQSPVTCVYELAMSLIEEKHPFAKMDSGVAMFWNAVRRSPALRARARELQAAFERSLAELLAESVSAPKDDPVAFLVATMVVSTWRSAYRDALARQDAGQKPATIRAAYTALFQRGFEGVRRCVKGTVYG